MRMDWIPEKGDQVSTPLGKAVVQSLKGSEVLVYLKLTGHKGYFKKEKIKLESKAASPTRQTVNKVDKPKKQPVDNPYLRKLKCIDSLRFGLVPEPFIEELTVDFEDVKKWTLSSFPKQNKPKRQKVHQIIGHYGEGKSHHLSVIRYLAKKEGYIVASVEVDGKKVSFSNPQSLLYGLWTRLQGNNLSPVMPLLNLYLKAIRKGNQAPRISFSGIDRIQRIYRLIHKLDQCNHLDDVNYLIDSILVCSEEITANEVKEIIKSETPLSSSEISISSMISRSVDERGRNFVESLVGTSVIARLAGYKGLVITVDEFEVESSLLCGKNQIGKFHNTLENLFEYIKGEMNYPDVPIAIYFATVGLDENNRGYEFIDSMVRASKGEKYTIEPCKSWDLAMAETIHELYKDAYSCNHHEDIEMFSAFNSIVENRDINDSGYIRYLMKQYIGFLDSVYNPSLDNEEKIA